MNHPFTYVGCFVEFEYFQSAISHIRKNPPENDIQYPHVTFEYKPEKVNKSLFGERVHITIVGYGNDGENEGVKVRLESDNRAIQKMISQIEVPHITIAVSSGGKAVNTRYLDFRDIAPIELDGKYGGHAKGCKPVIE